MGKEHKHCGTSNVPDCFSGFIGCTVKGFLENAFPLNRADLAGGSKTLVFDCGWGLTVSGGGAYWTEPPADVKRAIEKTKTQLRRTQAEIKDVLALAGA